MSSAPEALRPRRRPIAGAFLRRIHANESGATAVIAAVTSPLLLALAGLGAEGAYAYFKHATMQSVADAAALSGAIAYQTTMNRDAAKLEARAVAAQMGYASADNLSVTVNSPPATGPNTSATGAVEVILSLQQQPMLTRVFRSDPYTIRSRSVSRPGASASGCILALNKTASSAVTVNGNTAVTLSGCVVYANSNSSTAVNTSGGGTLIADEVHAVGGIDASNVTATKYPNDREMADPYASVPNASFTCPTPTLPDVITGPAVIQPGVYCKGLKLKSGNITMAPGAYYVVGGPFEVASQATVDATAGVTIITASYNNYIYSASIGGGAVFRIVAPTTGPFSGLAFYSDRTISVYSNIIHSFTGQANMSWTGAIYAPTSAVTFAGGPNGANGCTQIIAQTVKVTGGTSLSANCAGKGTKPIGNAPLTALVD